MSSPSESQDADSFASVQADSGKATNSGDASKATMASPSKNGNENGTTTADGASALLTTGSFKPSPFGAWQNRVKTVMCGDGYEPLMRRSLQSVVLFEARRMLKRHMASLRPFQRKVAYLEQANALAQRMEFCFPNQRMEIMWRTATSREPLNADLAWKRYGLVTRELTSLANQIKPFMMDTMGNQRTHQEACDLLLQSLYDGVQGKPGKKLPRNWEHAHNHVFVTFRLYYKGDELDPDFPPPGPLLDLLPADRFGVQNTYPGTHTPTAGMNHAAMPAASPGNGESRKDGGKGKSAVTHRPSHAAGGHGHNPAEYRRSILKEVREHMDLLKEFEGVVPSDDLAQRKRQLFEALPPAPPSMAPWSSGSKHARYSN